MSQSQRVHEALQRALRAIEDRLQAGDLPPSGALSRAQLQSFQIRLLAMLAALDGNEGAAFETDSASMGHIIADSWPFDSVLGELILRAEQEYRGLCLIKGKTS